jgi:hypothetical protein
LVSLWPHAWHRQTARLAFGFPARSFAMGLDSKLV